MPPTPASDSDPASKLPPAGQPTGLPDPGEEEVQHYDDATIGRAFRWSFVALVGIAIAAAAIIFWLRRPPPPAAAKVTQLAVPEARVDAVAAVPVARFTDVTRDAGIRFERTSGAYGDKLLPESMGGGVAFFDFDNDGDQDLLFVNGTYWPGHVPAGAAPPIQALYANDGHGHFTDITAGSGLDVSLQGMGCAVGDFDNDGLVDVFLTAVGENRLFHNLGKGKFADVTASSGIVTAPEDWGTACAFVDYDRDGRLDLVLANYVRWSREIDFEVGYKLVGIGRAYGQPRDFPGTFARLFHNEGGGRFKDVTADAGLQIRNTSTGVPAAKALGILPVDLDADGWLDLVLANDTVQNFVFHNQRDGTFKEIGSQSGIAFDSYGQTRGAMGLDAAHFRDDGALGIAISNFANEMTALYVAQKLPLIFTDEAITEGIGPQSRLPLKFGIFFFDYDLDGRLDLLSANGHLEPDISKVQQSQSYAQPAQLFWNSGRTPCFVSVPPEKAGSDLFKPMVGRGSAYADIDGDGDLDVVIAQTAGAPLLLRNDQTLGHHWLRLKLVGTEANRDAIGADVRVRVGGQELRRLVMPTRSYLSQSELPVTFGLGAATRIESASITWPGGAKQVLSPVALDALTVVTQAR